MEIIIKNMHVDKFSNRVGCFKVDRSTVLGNPYPITDKCTRQESIRLYKKWLWAHMVKADIIPN